MMFARYSKGETFSFLLLSSGGRRTNQIASNLLFLLLARHSLQAASALASCVGSNLRFSPSPNAKTNGEPFDSPFVLVGQCIKLSNEFLNDYKLVIEFSEWIRIKKSHHRVKKS